MSAENETIDLFVHREGTKPLHVRAGSREQLAEVLRKAGVEVVAGLRVFVGQPAAVAQPDLDKDDAEDSHDPVDTAATLADLGVRRSGHVHCHRCRRVAVAVHYNGREARRSFSPAATVAFVTAWARRRFRLSDADAEKLVLQVCDSTVQPRPDEHVGELARGQDCRLCFDLVFDQRIEG